MSTSNPTHGPSLGSFAHFQGGYAGGMKHSEFTLAVSTEFGEHFGRTLVRDVVLDEFGLSAADALAAGNAPRNVWTALCHAMDVPEHRIHGAGRGEPKK